MVTSTLTIQDILTRNIKLDMDSILPFIILPLLLLTATISRAVTIIILVIIAMGALYVISRPREKNRSKFFYSWTLSSGLYMFQVFELGILYQREITRLENFVFRLLLACTCYFFYKVKVVADFELATGSSKEKEYSPVLSADSIYCQICQIEVNDRLFHSIWWDCCVIKQNYGYFLAGQVFAFATLLYGANLGLTAVCQPYVFYGSILLPHDCGNVYFEFLYSLCFVVCMYGLGYLLVISLVLIHQLLVYIPKYSATEIILLKLILSLCSAIC